MKATGIVRRIDAGVIITPKPKKVHKCWDFCKFAPLNALVSKTVFIHSKKRGEFHLAFIYLGELYYQV